MSTIRLLIVDDQPLLRAGFSMILGNEDDLELVGEASDGLEALELVATRRPDVVLMDIRMPKLDGIEATRRIMALDDPPVVLILTTFDLDDYVFAALRAGASGFLLKDVPADDLIDAIRVDARGDAMIAPSITQRLLDNFVEMGTGASPSAAPGIADLTERESQVLHLMARGLSNAENAGELILGETTVKTHVGRILMKLGARDRVQAVIAAYEAGVVTPGRDDA